MVVPVNLISLGLLVPCEVNRYESDFSLDTGSNITAINKTEADRVGIKPLSEKVLIGSDELPRAHIPLSIKGAPEQNIYGVIWNLNSVISWTDMIQYWNVLINEDGLNMTRRPTGANTHVLKRADGSSPSVTIPAKINGHDTIFMYDTGAKMFNLNPTDAKKFGMTMLKPELVSANVNGGPVQNIWIRFQYEPNLAAWKDVAVNFDVKITAEEGVKFIPKFGNGSGSDSSGLVLFGVTSSIIISYIYRKEIMKLLFKK